MADVLLQFAHALAHSKTELNKQEVEVFRACLLNSVRDGAIGASLAGTVAWIASGRLSRFFRYNLVGGVGFMCGMWCVNRSFHSSFDHILSMEGRMKNELARVMAQQQFRNDPQKMKLLAKHFYSEEVFDDSASDRPKLMFRQRNAYIDNAAQIPRSSENYGHDDDSDEKKIADRSMKKENNDIEKVRKAVAEWRQANDDPFDWLFDRSDMSEEVVQPSNPPSSRTKQQSRRQRRLHRRNRLHHRHHGDSLTMDDA